MSVCQAFLAVRSRFACKLPRNIHVAQLKPIAGAHSVCAFHKPYATWQRRINPQSYGESFKSRPFGLTIAAAVAFGVSAYAMQSVHAEEADKDIAEEEDNLAAVSGPDWEKIPEIPGHCKYLIVGGGTAAFAASRAIKVNDPTAQVLIVSSEEHLPYSRPPLSKGLWFTGDEETIKALRFKLWNGKEKSIYFQPPTFFVEPKQLPYEDHGGIAVAKGRTVTKLDPYKKKAILDNGWTVTYEKCLLATGGKPRTLPCFDKASSEVKKRLTVFRKIDDFQRLYEVMKNVKSVAIVGGGFLGSELACALGHVGSKKKKVPTATLR